jgi:peptide deformylase
MILPVLKYGHPILRQKGTRIEKITPEITKLIEDMLETMYAAAGVGLAAQQVGMPLQLTVIDVKEVRDRPSTLEIGGQPAMVADHMPLVLINPEFKPAGKPVVGPEGCLSFPELYADVERPDSVDVTALNEKGETIRLRCGGLLARAVQHETDHLHGILFIDRMSTETKKELKPELDALQEATKAALKKGGTDQ